MKTQTFIELLSQHQDKSLLFEYAPNMLVGANYHITEVKHIAIASVDCGAQEDAWNETIIQLWESPSELGKTEYMSAYKALGILKKVDRIKGFDLDTQVKFEYGNHQFHTTQLTVSAFEILDQAILIKLTTELTDCKAKGICGVPEPETIQKEQSCCEPSSGCC
ncbi:MAG: hypothetical protein BM564_06280 [Bacteroidetes bacterium MedPE-SWsnd-G2]|nr:MAG: hypothetical protein BM564_06280 [Bacteroidetes bacterium MedPE-SWsnd-G2]